MGTRSVPVLKITVGVLAVLLAAAVWLIAQLTVGGGESDSARDAGDTGGVVAPAMASDAAAPTGQAAAAGELDKQVRSASVSLEVPDITAAVAGVRTAVRDIGGSIQAAETSTGSPGYPTPLDDAGGAEAAGTLTAGWVTALVPDDRLEDFLDDVRGIGHVTAENTSTQGVTTQYDDLTARIPILEAEQAALTGMLARAATVADELGIRDRLVSVTADLQSLRAQLSSLQQSDAMATVSISLTVPASERPPSDVQLPWFSWYELQQAFARGLAAFMSVVYATVTVVVATLPLWAVALVVFLVLRRRRRDRPDAG